jgi:hypothetical protein
MFLANRKKEVLPNGGMDMGVEQFPRSNSIIVTKSMQYL